jgi:transcriptional regulator of acetoin/glycerol metabolism
MAFLEKLTAAQLPSQKKNPQHFSEPGVSLLCSQQPIMDESKDLHCTMAISITIILIQDNSQQKA